ncbi:MAG: hypothetical protein NTU88_02145 [Armatimonadetes bacterium]|nr:hypothetical protein [Armatimonadota bacterium]
MSIEQSKPPWYRHPLGAMAVGIVMAAAVVLPTLRYGPDYLGGDAVLLAALIVPAVCGFMVGLLCRSNGAVCAAVAGILFVSGLGLYLMLYSDRHLAYDLPSARAALAAIPILLAAIFGSFGENAAASSPRSRALTTAFVIAAFPILAGVCWLKLNAEISGFRRDVLPVIERRFSSDVIKLPPGTVWTVERVGLPTEGTRRMSALTRIRGHRLYIRVSQTGDAMYSCRFSYEAPDRVVLTDEKSARDYLRQLGVSDKIMQRLKNEEGPRFIGRSWFCGNDILPRPRLRLCEERPSCGEDFAVTLFSGRNPPHRPRPFLTPNPLLRASAFVGRVELRRTSRVSSI